MPPIWTFRKMDRGEPAVNPIQGEFFNSESLATQSDALVREVIQNSLDAGREREVVRVRIMFSSPHEAVMQAEAQHYLQGLVPHVTAEDSGLLGIPSTQEKMPFLVIEDFGTRGLTGAPDQDDDRPGQKNDFYYFWRNVGRTGKTDGQRGTWGLGKSVFPNSSRINSFFGLTVRQGDTAGLLMGQSVVMVHHVDGNKYAPYGYFGRAEAAGSFVMPEAGERRVKAFADTFRLMRGDEPGLSIVIPYPKEEITPPEILRSVIKHYFYPILNGELVVTVCDADAGQDVTAESIEAMAANQGVGFASTMLPMLALAKWAIAEGKAAAAGLHEFPDAATPKWQDYPFEEEMLKGLRKTLREGGRIAMKVPVWVRPFAGEKRHSYFHIYMERNLTNDRQRPLFVREGVTISDAVKEREAAVRAIVVIDDKPLAKLLGDAENPAHTEWQERSLKFKDKYDKGPSVLRFLKKSVTETVRILTTDDQTLDPTPVADIFFVPDPVEEAQTETPEGGGDDGEEPGDIPEVTAKPRRLRLEDADGGFRVYLAPTEGVLPRQVTILAAYNVRRGNPFAKYQEADFRFDGGDIRIAVTGGEIVTTENNRLVASVSDASFELRATGFRTDVDLRVKANTSEV
jgi:hypothetical protein